MLKMTCIPPNMCTHYLLKYCLNSEWFKTIWKSKNGLTKYFMVFSYNEGGMQSFKSVVDQYLTT